MRSAHKNATHKLFFLFQLILACVVRLSGKIPSLPDSF